MGPAPVTRIGPRLPEGTLADRGNLFTRLSRRTVVGSSSTPSSPSDRSIFTTYSGSTRHQLRHEPVNLFDCRAPCIGRCRHMSHSPTAQLGQGRVSGLRRTIPATRSPG